MALYEFAKHYLKNLVFFCIMSAYNQGKHMDIKQYNLATEKLKKKMSVFSKCYDNTNYSLTDLVRIIRQAMSVADVRQKFINVDNPVSFASGFCALNSYVIYNLTGGDKYWEYYHISPKYGFNRDVAYLRNKKNNQFLYLGDIQDIPYELGHPIDGKKFKCPQGGEYLSLIKAVCQGKE